MANSKTLLGFVTGIATGVLVGILFAPDRGARTRHKIASKTSDLSEAVKESFDDFIDGLKDLYGGKKAPKGNGETATGT